MERKIGETFEFEGKTLQATKVEEYTCSGCFLEGRCNIGARKVVGDCDDYNRDDNSNVVFTEVEEEQKLNLLEILKYCPEGTRFWSPMLGDVKFICILSKSNKISVMTDSQISWDINADATITFGIANRETKTTEEPMIFPSKEQRDWSKVEYKQPIDALPKSWEEFCETHEVQKGEAYIKDISTFYQAERTGDTRDMNADKNILPNEQACRQHLALMQLHQLRDCWRQGWLPDWNDGDQNKYVIAPNEGEFEIYEYHTISRFLAFQDEKRANKFRNCFIDLIRKAGDLL